MKTTVVTKVPIAQLSSDTASRNVRLNLAYQLVELFDQLYASGQHTVALGVLRSLRELFELEPRYGAVLTKYEASELKLEEDSTITQSQSDLKFTEMIINSSNPLYQGAKRM